MKHTRYPQELADSIAELARQAVQWFHDPSTTLHAAWTDTPISDDDVRYRIKGYQLVMDREIARITNHSYGGWTWRWEDGWEEKHDEWIKSFNTWTSTPEGRSFVLARRVWRYDLSSLPFPLQRALVTRWQELRDATEMPPQYGKDEDNPVVNIPIWNPWEPYTVHRTMED